MDDTFGMVRDMVARLLADRATASGTMAAETRGIDSALWSAFDELGLRGDTAEIGLEGQMAVLQELGSAAALVPYAESEVLGRWLAKAAGIETGSDTLAVIASDQPIVAGGVLRLSGQAIPWARHADRVLVLVSDGKGVWVAQVTPSKLQLEHGVNMTGEPLDVVYADSVAISPDRLHAVPEGVDARALMLLGALCRCASMLGALHRANEIGLQYSQDRKQFGKSLSQFQVIQSYLAEMSAEVCAVSIALDVAIEGAAEGCWGDVAVAKIRAGQAARIVTRLTHQIHGAIGATQEYPLHLWTRRLWAWRDEYGSETQWADELGRSLVASGGDKFWPRMTDDMLALEN